MLSWPFQQTKTIPLEKKGHGHSRVKIWCFVAQVDVLQNAETMQLTKLSLIMLMLIQCFYNDALIAFHLLQINTLWCLFVKRLSCSLVLFPAPTCVGVLWYPIPFLIQVSTVSLNYVASIYPLPLQTSWQQLKTNKKKGMWDSGTIVSKLTIQ